MRKRNLKFKALRIFVTSFVSHFLKLIASGEIVVYNVELMKRREGIEMF